MDKKSSDNKQLVSNNSRIVHIGFGAFHRAHQALYTEEHNTLNKNKWNICVVDLLGDGTSIENLREQNHKLSVIENFSGNIKVKTVSSIVDSLHPVLDGIDTILRKLASPEVTIVSMTVTEKGYYFNPSTRRLDFTSPDIIADLRSPERPKTLIGYLVQSLQMRRQNHIEPFTILSCDNIQGNGQITKNVVIEFAKELDESLAYWIENNVTFPSTMVDRIVPAVTNETLSFVEKILGESDQCAVVCEPFRQWVIEDNFVSDKPNWSDVGAQFVDDVMPYEEMKLRMLNGSHSFLAYLGYLAGYDYISETMTNPAFRELAHRLMVNEQACSLKVPFNINLDEYACSLIERFSNDSLQHKTLQIAADGSLKVPQRFIGSLDYQLQTGGGIQLICLAIAGWMRFVSGVDEKGEHIDVSDPIAEILKAICQKHKFKVTLVPEILAIESIFPEHIGQDPRVLGAITKAYVSLMQKGSKITLEEFKEFEYENVLV